MVVELIEEYTAAVGMKHRRSKGQFFTPPAVAEFMCRWLASGKPAAIYDPAFGLGAFHKASTAVDSGILFQASEIDPAIFRFHGQHVQSNNLSVLLEDYFDSWHKLHDAIVCNPPYMKFQNFTNRLAVLERFETQLNLRLSGLTNLASVFLVKSLSELSRGGRLAYIMPLEFLNTGYGRVVKERLLSNGLLKSIIRIIPEKDVFPDATTSVGIILVENNGIADPVSFYSTNSISELSRILGTEPIQNISRSALDPAEKWIRYFEPRQHVLDHSNLVSVNTYGAFTRGIATGANEFFVLRPSEAKIRGLQEASLIRCISKSAQISGSYFDDSDFDALAASDAPVFLAKLGSAATKGEQEYIRFGEEMGYQSRYLTRSRNPWYKLESRAVAPLLFGVFSRERFKVIRNHSSAVNLTCYHGFYPNMFGKDLIERLFLYFQSRAARSLLELNMRRYGAALDKFEPNDLNQALAPSPAWLALLPLDIVNSALESCRLGCGLTAAANDQFDMLLPNETDSDQR